MGEKLVRSIAIVLGVLCILLLGGTVGAVVYYNNYASTHSHTDADYISLASQLATANENISSLNNQLSILQSELASNNTESTNLKAQIDALTSQLASANSQLEAKDATQATIDDYYNSLIYVLNTEVHDISSNLITANNQITSLQNQLDSLNAIANLTASVTWVNNQTVSQPAGSYTTWSKSASYAGYVSINVSSSTTSSTYANVIYSAYGVNYNVQTNVGTSGTAYFPVLPSSNITGGVGNGLSSGTATETVTIIYYY
jgi:predicted RNase H-like nuclease (RuvC/YqgF family)